MPCGAGPLRPGANRRGRVGRHDRCRRACVPVLRRGSHGRDRPCRRGRRMPPHSKNRVAPRDDRSGSGSHHLYRGFARGYPALRLSFNDACRKERAGASNDAAHGLSARLRIGSEFRFRIVRSAGRLDRRTAAIGGHSTSHRGRSDAERVRRPRRARRRARARRVRSLPCVLHAGARARALQDPRA